MFTSLFILLFIFLINSFIDCEYGDLCKNANSPTSTPDCTDMLPEVEEDLGYHCCFTTRIISGNTYYDCDFLIEDDFNDIESYKDEDSNIIDIDCYQSHLNKNMNYILYLIIINLLLIII